MSVTDTEALPAAADGLAEARQPELLAERADGCRCCAGRQPDAGARQRTEAASNSPFWVSPASQADTAAVQAMLARCSRSSLFHRFHGPGDGTAYAAAQLRRPDDIVVLAWEGGRCIGMGVLAGRSELDLHLGVLVEDHWQRRGVGTALVTAMIGTARDRAVRSIHADVMGENQQLVSVLGRLGTTSVRLESGIFSVEIDLSVAA